MQTSIQAFNHTLEKSNTWLKELKETGQFSNEEEAYTALRAVLHSLRDRLIVDQAAHLASELPMLIRGCYYEGWRPALAPNKEYTKEDFLNSIRESLKHAIIHIDPADAARKVFQFLAKKISPGEIKHVQCELPKEILDLWSSD